jgi:TRAP-type uncharacterized transport system fused permease subunit
VLWLLLGYRSPAIAGLWGIALAILFSMLQGKYRPTRKQMYDAIQEGFYLVAILSLLLVAVGPLGQVMLTTNLSGRLGSALVQYLPDTQLILLIGAMIVSLILGMGLPTPVAYIIVALALVPFMQQIGIPPLQAHFFVFYFAVFSTLTPPVAVSVLAAAKLGEATFLSTAKDAIKIALTTFIIPFAFVFSPELMSFPDVTLETLIAVAEVIFVQVAVSVASYGFLFRSLNGVERAAYTVVALSGFLGFTFDTNFWYVAISLFIMISSYIFLAKKQKG